MQLSAMREKYEQCRAYHCVWTVSIRETGEDDISDTFEYNVTYFDGSCLVSLSQRMLSFYSPSGQMFNRFFGTPQEEIVSPCSPELFTAGLFGVSYLFADCMPGWLVHSKSHLRSHQLAAFPNLSSAESALSDAATKKLALIATEDSLISEAFYKTPTYVASFKPSVQKLI